LNQGNKRPRLPQLVLLRRRTDERERAKALEKAKGDGPVKRT